MDKGIVEYELEGDDEHISKVRPLIGQIFFILVKLGENEKL